MNETFTKKMSTMVTVNHPFVQKGFLKGYATKKAQQVAKYWKLEI